MVNAVIMKRPFKGTCLYYWNKYGRMNLQLQYMASSAECGGEKILLKTSVTHYVTFLTPQSVSCLISQRKVIRVNVKMNFFSETVCATMKCDICG